MKRAVLAAFLFPALVACDAPAPAPPSNPNVIDAPFLKPKLIDDGAHMQAYMAALPEGIYKEYRVEPIGSFYLDEIDDVIKHFLRNGRVWEKHLVELFPKYVKPGSTVIDAGAHVGVHTLTLARLAGPQGRVYSFEPQRKIYRELVFNLRLNGVRNVVPLRYALGDTTGIAEMSSATLGNEGGTPVGKGGDRVELRPIDSFGFRNVSFMKIDVEGFEDHVLEGAKLTIAKNRPVILIEIQGGQDYANTSPEIRKKIEATIARLKAMNYKVEQIYVHDYLALPQ